MRLELFYKEEVEGPVTSFEMDNILGFKHPDIEGEDISSFIVYICEDFLI